MGGGRVEGLARRDEVHCSPATPLVRPATIDKEAAIVGCTGANIDCSRVEMSCSVDEIGCKPAIVLIIVKTLDRRRANKGFYYDENHCKPATHLDTPPIDVCTAANIDGPCDIDHPTPVIEGCKPRETHRTPLEDHCMPATRLATPREAPGSYAVGPSPPGCHPAATGRHFQLIGTSFAQKLVRVW